MKLEFVTVFENNKTSNHQTEIFALGILDAQFHIFKQRIIASPVNATKIVRACFALHNFQISTNPALYIPAFSIDPEVIERKEIQRDAALNTTDERFKENELDIFQSLKDVTCSNPSKIIKIASVQKVSETYDLDMEKNKGGDTNFSENVQKIHRLLPEISTEITELRKRFNFLVEKELCDIHISILDKTNPDSPCDTCLNCIMCEKFFMLKIFKIIP
ncbi:hypothetical protein AVEN_195499-1 [Araneus ventricosus]|uniref:DDE Tnp4 domain-containing protein n=1 Tax=Araneus ventricosus TaxID=182803 RepID=A0A4Y2SVW5_ARAVE|nr:hypothetical protein AVEN_195499-1 [Araneus ventricosus]